jgi:signal peptidase I
MRHLFGTLVALAVAAGALSAVGCGAGTSASTTAVPPNGTAHAQPIKVYRELAGTMEPTLTIGQQLKATPLTSKPNIGDIVVFSPPKDAQRGVCGPSPHVIKAGGAACAEPESGEPARGTFIKRVVAGPGDEIYIREGHVFHRTTGTSAFTAQADSYIKSCPAGAANCNFPTPIRIPAGHWFMLGDNRVEPDDSRLWGPVPTQWIAGVVNAAAH